MSARAAGYCAVGFSLTAFLTLLLYVPTFLQRVGHINELLRVQADEFQSIANEAWSELLDVRQLPAEHHRIARQAARTRNLRKAYPLPDVFVLPENNKPACTCQTHNNCLPGVKGNPGRPGMDGEPGARGIPGEQGVVGIVPPIEVRGPSCRRCPPGPPGATGTPGEVGQPGNEGAQGAKGRNGEDGRPGYVGSPGQTGERGSSGKLGEQGPAALDGVRGVKGPPGEKGKTGDSGPKGPPGVPGGDGQRGADGVPGPVGSRGMQPAVYATKCFALGPPGAVGGEGSTGETGVVGIPGKDANYCPCPLRDSPKPKPNENVYGYVPQQHYEGGSQQPAIRPDPRQTLTGRSYPRVLL